MPIIVLHQMAIIVWYHKLDPVNSGSILGQQVLIDWIHFHHHPVKLLLLKVRIASLRLVIEVITV